MTQEVRTLIENARVIMDVGNISEFFIVLGNRGMIRITRKNAAA